MRLNTILKGIFLLSLGFLGCAQKSVSQSTSNKIKIVWVTSLHDDFSFINRWSYPEGIYRNEYGQLSCDGFCPDEIESMKDSKGRIHADSLKAFYQLVDTTHMNHTIECDAWCYEWAGTAFIDVYRKSKDTLFCATLNNASTHCSLELTIAGNNCSAIIDLNSIVKGRSAKYYWRDGRIVIDKNLLKQGILKAKFHFNFDHTEDPKKPMFWKGKIYSKIKTY